MSFRTVMLLVLAIALPCGIWVAARRVPGLGPAPTVTRSGSFFPPARLSLVQKEVGGPPRVPPRITHVQVVDFDDDGRPDILACDARRNRVVWFRQTGPGSWTERVLAEAHDLAAPAHATVVDLDQDGDRDVVVSLLGSVWPTDARMGRVVWLEQRPDGTFAPHVLLDDVRRVADAQAGDLDGDGDLDLVVAVFGYALGRIVWLENRGGRFREHRLMVTPGTIHVPIADYDGDGDLDVAAVVSQEEEEVWGFENLGGGRFAPRERLLFESPNFDLGMAGMIRSDLDQDGDVDLLVVAGDNLEIISHYPQPSHGCIWLENLGGWQFRPRRIATLGGAYGVATGDHDGDGDRDVVLVSMFNDWNQPGAASVVWYENDGEQRFRAGQVASAPIHLAAVACGDLNGDGRSDIVAGGMHLIEPFDRLGGVTVWLSQSGPEGDSP